VRAESPLAHDGRHARILGVKSGRSGNQDIFVGIANVAFCRSIQQFEEF
jgi:hypothetical protein